MNRRNRILILFAHPALQKSRVNRVLIDAVSGLEDVTVHDLYEVYPNFHIDVPREQEQLKAHDLIILHHPFYWYSCPPLLKQWIDLVLQYGFAYGHEGTALRGKKMLTVTTTGGGEQAYGPQGLNRFTVRELLRPFEQTARLCYMEYLPPFILQGTHRFTPEEIRRHADAYRELVVMLRDDVLDTERLWRCERMNEALEQAREKG